MKKFLITVFTVMLLTATSFTTGCLSGTKPEDGKINILSEHLYDSDMNTISSNSETGIYRLKTGEQYYISVNYGVGFFGCCNLIYNSEEVEIIERDENDYLYTECPMTGLKQGSVIIECDESYGAKREEYKNYLKILIIFE